MLRKYRHGQIVLKKRWQGQRARQGSFGQLEMGEVGDDGRRIAESSAHAGHLRVFAFLTYRCQLQRYAHDATALRTLTRPLWLPRILVGGDTAATAALVPARETALAS